MKLNRLIIAAMLIFTLFACKDKGVVSCYLTVARPPMEAINAYTKSLSSLEARDELVLTAKATIYTEGGSPLATDSATFEKESNTVTIAFSNLEPAESAYASLVIGQEMGEELVPIYSGCSDLFNIEDGKTIPVAICATKDEDYSFDYACATVTKDGNQVTYGENTKKLITFNSRKNDIDRTDLSKITFKVQDDTGTESDVSVLRAVCHNGKFYAVASGAKINYLVRCDKSDVADNAAITFTSENYISFVQHGVNSSEKKPEILDMRVRGGFLCLEIESYDTEANKVTRKCPYYCYIDLKKSKNFDESSLIKEEGKYSDDKIEGDGYTVYDYLFPLTVGGIDYQVLWNSVDNTLSFRSMQYSNSAGNQMEEKFKVTINYTSNTSDTIKCSRPLYMQDQGDLLFFANNYCVRIKDLANKTRDESVNATQIISLSEGDNYFKGVGLKNGKDSTPGATSFYDFTGICCYKDGTKLYAIYGKYGVFIFDITDKSSAPRFLDSYIMFNLAEAYYKAKKLYLFEEVNFLPQGKSDKKDIITVVVEHSLNLLNSNLKNGKMPTPSFAFQQRDPNLVIVEFVYEFEKDVMLNYSTHIGNSADATKTSDTKEPVKMDRNSTDYEQGYNYGSLTVSGSTTLPRGHYIYWGFFLSSDGWDNGETIYTNCYQGT